MYRYLRRRQALWTVTFAVVCLVLLSLLLNWLYRYVNEDSALRTFGTNETPIIAAVLATAALTYLFGRLLSRPDAQ
jgi:polyferredoxin